MVTALGELGLESMAAFALEEGLLRADVALPASQIAIADRRRGGLLCEPAKAAPGQHHPQLAPAGRPWLEGEHHTSAAFALLRICTCQAVRNRRQRWITRP